MKNKLWIFLFVFEILALVYLIGFITGEGDKVYDRSDLNGASGTYFGGGRIVCIPNVSTCQHEVGHAQDDFLRWPSESEKFKAAVDKFMEDCKKGIEDELFCENTINDAGVNGNPLREFIREDGDILMWGGYSELYAHIFEIKHAFLQPIPDSLNIYFLEGWDN